MATRTIKRTNKHPPYAKYEWAGLTTKMASATKPTWKSEGYEIYSVPTLATLWITEKLKLVTTVLLVIYHCSHS